MKFRRLAKLPPIDPRIEMLAKEILGDLDPNSLPPEERERRLSEFLDKALDITQTNLKLSTKS